MRTSKKEYEEVAMRCSSYERANDNQLTNSMNCECTSCLNCCHFTTTEHCTLDLFDSIAKTL